MLEKIWEAIKMLFNIIFGIAILVLSLVIQALPIVISVLILFWLFK